MTRAALLVLLPALAQAQGAHQTFACRATLTCDGAGACEPTDEIIPAFRLTRFEDGTHTIVQGPIEADASVPADGPLILWTEPGGVVHTLAATGQASPTTVTMLWQVVLPDAAIIRFLTCEVAR